MSKRKRKLTKKELLRKEQFEKLQSEMKRIDTNKKPDCYFN